MRYRIQGLGSSSCAQLGFRTVASAWTHALVMMIMMMVMMMMMMRRRMDEHQNEDGGSGDYDSGQ